MLNFVITLACFISIFRRGIRTFFNCKKPLSFVLKANFGPISPTVIPKNKKNFYYITKKIPLKNKTYMHLVMAYRYQDHARVQETCVGQNLFHPKLILQ